MRNAAGAAPRALQAILPAHRRPTGGLAVPLAGARRGRRVALARPGPHASRERQPGRRGRGEHGLAGHQRLVRGGQLLQPQQRQARLPAPERTSPASLPPRVTGVPGAGRGPSTRTGSRRRLTSAAMLGAGGQLLADEAALGEAHAVQLLEAALQQERPVDDEVAAAVGHAQREAQPVVLRRLDPLEPVLGDEAGHAVARQHDPQPQLGQARVDRHAAASATAPGGTAGAPVEDREHGELFAAASSMRHLGPQPVHVQPLHQRRQPAALGVQEDRSPRSWSRKSNRYLPCGVSSAA